MKRILAVLLFLVLVASLSLTGCAPKEPVILATTTSTADTGLLDTLVPLFTQKTGYKVNTVAVGTGQALALGEKGEADVLLVHSPASELKLVESGVAINRTYVMYNDYVIVGPALDPAGIKTATTAAEAFANIAAAQAKFVSRGDDSGTHKKEKELWGLSSITPAGTWYIESGTGMSATLTIAEEKQAYTISDRGTYLAFKKNLSLVVLSGTDGRLQNPYHVMQVSQAKFPNVNGRGAARFAEFLMSKEVQEIIAKFGVDKYGEPLFIPTGGK